MLIYIYEQFSLTLTGKKHSFRGKISEEVRYTSTREAILQRTPKENHKVQKKTHFVYLSRTRANTAEMHNVNVEQDVSMRRHIPGTGYQKILHNLLTRHIYYFI